jgi:hypothetical protein
LRRLFAVAALLEQLRAGRLDLDRRERTQLGRAELTRDHERSRRPSVEHRSLRHQGERGAERC